MQARKYRLVAFDMDGTLVEQPSSWWTLHEYFKTSDKARAYMDEYDEGIITYEEWMIKDIALWGQRTNIKVIEDVLSDYTLSNNSKHVVRWLQDREYEVVIVTSGLTVLAEKIAEDLGIQHVLANDLVVDEGGFLTGEVIPQVDPRRKHEALDPLLKKLGVSLQECVGVGDSRFDVELLKNVGLGIAVGDDKQLREVARIVIRDLIELTHILD